jgi:hypothetical protein
MKAILSPQVNPDIQPGAGRYGIALVWHP